MNARDWWFDQTPEQQSKFKRLAAISVMLGIGLFMYYGSGRDEKVEEEVIAMTEVTLGTELLEDDIRGQVDRELQVRDEESADQAKRVSAMENILSELSDRLGVVTEDQEALRNAGRIEDEPDTGQQKPNYPPPPAIFPNARSQTAALMEAPPLQVQFVGGITRVQGLPLDPPADDRSKKKSRSVYLAPSFMEAMLLEGLEALTTQGAEGNPEPIMLRVQAPAVLPNRLKADLKGCFVIANMVGVLAKERVEGRLVSLHCLSHDGHAVIDAEIKGHLADSDGKKGLAGITVSKMGAQISRALIAGIFGGLGEAITLDSVTQTTSALGTTQVIDSDRALQAGLGQGIKSGSQEIQKIFLELARQSGPVIEIGAAKKVWVVLTEGVELEIRERVTYDNY